MSAVEQQNTPRTELAGFLGHLKKGTLWKEHSPTVLAIVLYVVLIALIWFRYPPAVMAYLSDIFNSSTLAETGRPSYPVWINNYKGVAFVVTCVLWVVFGLRAIDLAKRLVLRPYQTGHGLRMASLARQLLLTDPEKRQIPEGSPHTDPAVWKRLLQVALLAALILLLTLFIVFFPVASRSAERFFVTWPWIIILLAVLSAWVYSFYHIYALNQQYQPHNLPPSSDSLLSARSFFWDWLRFVLLPFGLIALFTILLHSVFHVVDAPIVAMVGAGSIVGFISVSQAFGRLGHLMRVRWLVVNTLSWLPIIGLVLALTSQWWPENGVPEVWNSKDRNHLTHTVPQHPLFANSWKHDGPLVIICASGGGTRAAIFTAAMLTRIWEQDTKLLDPDPKGDGDLLRYWQDVPNRGLDTILYDGQDDRTIHPGRLLLQCADVMSGVSGGSLASAYFVERLYRNLPDNTTSPWEARTAALRGFFDPNNLKAPHPPVTWYNVPKGTPAFSLNFGWDNPLTESDQQMYASHEQFRVVDEQFRAFDMNPFINAMRQNYVAPIFSGFLQPWLGRGPRYEDTWKEYFGWNKPAKSTPLPRRLSDFAGYEKSGALPTLILNSTATRTGSRLAFTNLSPDMFEPLGKLGPTDSYFGERSGPTDSDLEKRTSGNDEPGELTSRYDPLPGRIITHSYLDERWDVPLATAVHASANFPYVLPALKLRQYDNNPDNDDLWDAIDGGIDDNYGIDSVMALLRKNREEIKRRGVLIFQIDPSFMSLDPSDGGWVPENITLPQNATWRSGQNTDATLGSLYLRELCALFQCKPPRADEVDRPVGDAAGASAQPLMLKPVEVYTKERVGANGPEQPYFIGYITQPTAHVRKDSPRGFAFFKVRLGEAPRDQVLTYWHLDDAERRKLYRSLCVEQNGKAILTAARWLRDQMGTRP